MICWPLGEDSEWFFRNIVMIFAAYWDLLEELTVARQNLCMALVKS